MDGRMPAIIDLDAEAAKLVLFRGRTSQTTSADRKGSLARLAAYRDGILLLSKSAGTGHWEVHPEDELVHILEGAATLEIVEEQGPQSYALGAGMMAVVPQGAWHRFRSADGRTGMSLVVPGDNIDLDVADPRPHLPGSDQGAAPTQRRAPIIVDLASELATLTMFRRSPHSTAADRSGSVAELAPYRDGLALAIKSAGRDHWERHLTGDEFIHILDGSVSLEMVRDDGPPKSFLLRAGTVAVIPQGAWHRFLSEEGATQLAVTPFPGESIELDVDDPRMVERKPA